MLFNFEDDFDIYDDDSLIDDYDDETEYFFMCPYCWQEISMLLDPSAREQTYVEDCEVCCNPIEIRYAMTPDGNVEGFSAAKMQ